MYKLSTEESEDRSAFRIKLHALANHAWQMVSIFILKLLVNNRRCYSDYYIQVTAFWLFNNLPYEHANHYPFGNSRSEYLVIKISIVSVSLKTCINPPQNTHILFFSGWIVFLSCYVCIHLHLSSHL